MATAVKTALEWLEEAVRVEQLHSAFVREGRAFAIGNRHEDLSNGDHVETFLENTSSDYKLDCIIAFRASGLCDVDWSFEATEDTEGTALTIQGLNDGESISPPLDATETITDSTGSYTHGTNIVSDIVPGSSSWMRMGSTLSDGISIRLNEGNNVLFELTNASGSSLDRLSIHSIVYAVDGSILET